MKIAVSSCSWWHDTLEDGIRKAARAGFAAYEPLMFPEVVFPLHGNIRTMKAGELVQLLCDHGMTLAALHIAAILTLPESRYRGCIDYAQRAIRFAVETGCNLVVLGGPDRKTEPFFLFLKAMDEISPLLEETGVRIALEYHAGNWIQFNADYEHIFDCLPNRQIGIALDTGHFTASGVDPEEVALRFGSRIFHVHIKDHVGQQSVPLGCGETNNFGMVRRLKEMGYAGFLSQEIECGQGPQADQAAAEGLRYMQQLIRA
jgi:sugar phosphate isomerase/epimerase